MKVRAPVATAIAIAVGLIVLLGYFFEVLVGLRQFLLQWAITLSAVALLVGVFNLISVHSQKVSQGGVNALYSSVLIFSLLTTFALVLVLGPTSTWPSWIFDHIQVPIEASLMAVLAVSLAYASARLLRRRPDLFSIIFVLTVLLILLGMMPFLTEQIPLLSDLLVDLRAWIASVPAAAGARGILLGIALGIIATGLRILLGTDRPYGG